jgi:hypothetical protein
MEVDWNVETDSGGFYKPGVYKVRIESIEEVEAKSGSQQLRVKTKFADGDYAGKQLTEHITLLPQVMWKLVKFIKAMGIDTSKMKKMDTNSNEFRKMLQSFYGRTTIWTVAVVKNRDGKDVNDITDYNEDTEQSWNDPVEEPAFLNE